MNFSILKGILKIIAKKKCKNEKNNVSQTLIFSHIYQKYIKVDLKSGAADTD